ncbi:MAG: hypothetical protein HQL43_16780 [Alphaproteobacteria bacterium]|nr:hypothetical protein [Alphaproteobacteria bacterium]
MSIFKRLFARKRQKDEAAAQLYRRIVEQARLPEFYESLGVPDSVEGRFDLLALHAFLVMEALSPTEPEGAQALFDLMFDDLESNLRELGASDIRIGARVKKLAQDFLGRSHAYRTALENQDDSLLMAALDRNVFAKAASTPLALQTLAHYTRRCRAAQETANAQFPPIEMAT